MNDEYYMNIAYKEALKAFKKGEIPVGAVIAKNNKIISKSHNNRQKKYNIFGHAEINAIIKAEKKIKDWRLDECTMYVTMYPCKMCEMIIKESRIRNVIYMLENEKNKEKSINNIQTNVCKTIFENYKILLKTFFKEMRN